MGSLGVNDVFDRLLPLVMGGSGFSYQIHKYPESLPIVDIIRRALDAGVRAFDTSPYYEPSERLMGQAFQHSKIAASYARKDITLMTKVGRIKEDLFDYSPEWIRTSVKRSLTRFATDYLDVVFCHDVEFVSKEEAVVAVGVLFELVQAGTVRYVGISGYNLDVLTGVAEEVSNTYGRPLDIVQNWAQLNLQNTRLETYGLPVFRKLGVKAVCSASPLASGLLRDSGPPVGALGNWHPAPQGLRLCVQAIAADVSAAGSKLSDIALKYAMSKAHTHSDQSLVVTTIMGISTMEELEANIKIANSMLETPQQIASEVERTLVSQVDFGQRRLRKLNNKETLVCENIRQMLGTWVDYDLQPASEQKASRALNPPRMANGSRL